MCRTHRVYYRQEDHSNTECCCKSAFLSGQCKTTGFYMLLKLEVMSRSERSEVLSLVDRKQIESQLDEYVSISRGRKHRSH